MAALGTCVSATLMTPGSVAGDAAIVAKLPPLPADATTTTPSFTALQLAATALHTWMATRLASGAMPLCMPSVLAPATMSATWVPCVPVTPLPSKPRRRTSAAPAYGTVSLRFSS